MSSLLNNVEKVLNERVRPVLQGHGGDVRVVSCENGLLKLRMQGPCASCPSAALENEQIFEAEIKSALPAIQQVVLVTGVSDELLDMARSLLSKKK